MIMADDEEMSNRGMQFLGDPQFRAFKTNVPKGWSITDRYSYISVSEERLRAHFVWQNEGHREGTSVRATHPVPPSCGLFYFEVRIIQDGGVAVGLSTQFASLAQLPGTDEHSYGYHGSDGLKYHDNEPGHGEAYGPPFTVGDVIGCGLNFMDNSCFFTKNGHHLGVAFTDLNGWVLYPAVGMQSVGGMIDANFGQYPFIFDVADIKKGLGMVLRNEIDKVSLPVISSTTNADISFNMEKVVMTHLLHNGFCGTASVFASATGQDVSGEVDVVKRRQQVLSLVLEGQISQAMELTNLYYPGLLDEHPNLQLVLRVRQFIEVLSGADTKYLCADHHSEPEPPPGSVIMNEAMGTDSGDDVRGSQFERILDCGRKLHAWHARLAIGNSICDQYRDMVRDAFALIAYSDPHSSPVGWQLDPSQREIVADLLKEAMTNVNNETVLELKNYAKELLRLMDTNGIGKVAFINFDDVVTDLSAVTTLI